MIIAYRPAEHCSRDFTCIENENGLANIDAEPGEKVMHVKLGERGQPNRSAVVFRAHGAAARTLRKGNYYVHFVELSPEELVSGIAALPPHVLADAIKTVLEASQSALAKKDVYAFPENLAPREFGLPAASDIIETSNAIARGLVEYLSGNGGDVPSAS